MEKIENGRKEIVYSTKPKIKESFGYTVNAVPIKKKYYGEEIIKALYRSGIFMSSYGQPRLEPRQGGLAPCLCGPKDKLVKAHDSSLHFRKKENPQLQNRTERKENLHKILNLM